MIIQEYYDKGLNRVNLAPFSQALGIYFVAGSMGNSGRRQAVQF